MKKASEIWASCFKKIKDNETIKIRPGEALRDILKSKNMQIRSLSSLTGYHSEYIQLVINGRVMYDEFFAMELEKALGVESKFWMVLQEDYYGEL